MPQTDLRAALNYLCRTAGPSPDGGPTDRQLLDRFAADRDEAAFATLVRRHAALVLAACRRVLHHADDAEDAFQATFLVLARKPKAVRSAESVGPWLYTVALRQAARLKAATLRRKDRELASASRPVAAVPEPTLREVESVLDEELGALPARLRSPLVLCYLEARTRDEAARELGWSVRTLQRRLDEGRRKLHARLLRRGASLSAALLTLGLAQPNASAVRAACACATSRGALGTEVSARVAALAQATMRRMVVTRLAAVVAMAFALAGAVGAGAYALRPALPDETRAAADKPAPARPSGRDAFGDPLPAGAVARLGTVRFNHGEGLQNLLFTPDGKTVVSTGEGTFRLWDAATGREQGSFSTDKGQWWDDQAVLAAGGKELITLTQDPDCDRVRVWDLALLKEARQLQLPVRRNGWSVSLRNALSPDGRRCVSHTAEGVHVLETATGAELCTLPKAGKDARAVAFAGNDRVVTADPGRNVEVWEAATGKPVLRFDHRDPVEILAASPDGRRLATLEHHTYAVDRFLDRDTVHVWDLASGTRERELTVGPGKWLMRVSFSPDGKLLLAASAGKSNYEVAVWEAATGRRLHTLEAAGLSLAVSPDGGRMIEGAPPGKFELWDLRAGRQLSPEAGRYARARALHLSADGNRAVTAGYGAVSEWDVAACQRLRGFDLSRTDAANLRAVSPDGRYALSSEGDWPDARATLWDVAAGRPLHTFPAGAAAVFSHDSARIALTYNGKEPFVSVRDVRTGREISHFREDKAGGPLLLSFAADGEKLFVLGAKVAAYDTTTGKLLFAWRKPAAAPDADTGPGRFGTAEIVDGRVVERRMEQFWWRAGAFSPSGTLAAFNTRAEQVGNYPGRDRLVLCDATTGRVYRRWRDGGLVSPGTEHMLFSPDGRLVASTDQTVVHVWEVATSGKVRTFRGHRGTVESLAFSADGRRLASSSVDSTTLVWDLTPGKPAATTGDQAVAAWWADLAGDDAARASDAAWHLAAIPGPAVTLLRQHLRPVTADDTKAARARIAELDSESFDVREKAAAELERGGTAAVPLLERALRDGPSLEAKRRVEQLLEKLGPLPASGEPLRAWRALAVLERAGTPQAKRLLQELAAGEPDVWLTREARDALRRLAK
jgi:RNA polymerase sigma factor (sigma-70 family)